MNEYGGQGRRRSDSPTNGTTSEIFRKLDELKDGQRKIQGDVKEIKQHLVELNRRTQKNEDDIKDKDEQINRLRIGQGRILAAASVLVFVVGLAMALIRLL